MNRRSFFALAGVATPLPSLASTDPPPDDDPVNLWWPMVNEVDRCRAVSSEGTLTLEVSMARPGEEELEVVTEGTRVVGYSLRGRRLLDGFFPGVTVVETFSLFWDDQPIPIPPRFWNDLAGFRIQTLGVDLSTLDLAQRARAEEYAARLDRPRIVLSADAGTALIEWVRREEFDSKSTFRWIVSRAGNVLRHRERPPRGGLR
ncbi:MAG: hypothetical protein ACKV19_22850 [Verrucomicrobiales bacterium]